MTTHVATMLQHGGRDNARRLRMLKLALLREHFARDPSLVEGFERLRAALAERTADDVLDHGTTFFWKSVHACCGETVGVGAGFHRSANYLLRTGFDSYFDWLPDGAALSLPPDDVSDLVLPRLGLHVPSRGEPILLCRKDATTIDLRVGDRAIEVNIHHVDPSLALRCFDVPGSRGARLVLVGDASLFDEPYRDRITPDIANGDALAALIGRSLALIEAADPELGARLDSSVDWYFPIDSPDQMTHNSFSVRYLFGAIFLSAAYEDLRLAEAMVHEFHHNELYLLQESEMLAGVVENDVFYSPFRPDPRPFDGLMHALFVFTGVANFIARAERLPTMTAQARGLRHRRCEVVRQLRIGLTQVPSARLTPIGAELVELVTVDVVRHEEEFGPLRGLLPEPLAVHLSNWKTAHAGARHLIQIPEGVEVQ